MRAARYAKPRDRPCSHFADSACKTNRIPCLRGRPPRAAKRQKRTRRSACPGESAEITWKSLNSVEKCGNFLKSEEIPGNPNELPWNLTGLHHDPTYFHAPPAPRPPPDTRNHCFFLRKSNILEHVWCPWEITRSPLQSYYTSR